MVDTPGFDNPALSNLEAFEALGDYLLDKNRIQVGFFGIIYIHRAGDPLRSRALVQNIGVISDVFLGDSGLSRLVIMVITPTPETSEIVPTEDIHLNPVFREAERKGAKIIECSLEVEAIDGILLSCASQSPVLLRIQTEGYRNSSIDISAQVQERLGYIEADEHRVKGLNKRLALKTKEVNTLEGAVAEKDAKITELSNARAQFDDALAEAHRENGELHQNLQLSRQKYDQALETLQATLEDAKSKLAECAQAYTQSKQQLASSRDESTRLRQQLQEVQSEYASLRSNLQIQENIEQTDIVRTLNDLNRNIDDLGRLFSEHLVDNFAPKAVEEKLGKLTALDARHMKELKGLLGHVDGHPSLITLSSKNIGMPIEDFLDYAIRTLLCKHLCRRIFSPFHPAVHSSVSDVMSDMYDRVQQQEPQPVAAKWRANSFKAVYDYRTPEAIAELVELAVQEFVNKSLSPLLAYFFGKEAGVTLQVSHRDSLVRLYRTAWDWNATLKGEVIVLGDFYPTYYAPTHRFDSSIMVPFETSSAPSKEETILGTFGLGLLVSRAIGGGRKPEVTVVVKATVGTKGLYT